MQQEGTIKTIKLSDLIDVSLLQSIMDDFYKITGFGVGIIDNDGNILVKTGWQDICTKFHRVHPETRKKCIESDIYLSENTDPGNFNLYKCKNHLWDMSSPIVVSDEHIGNIFLGQFLFDDEDIDYDFFRSYARQYGFDEERYIEALDKVPRWSRKAVNYVMSLYSKLALLLSEMGWNNLMLKLTIGQKEETLKQLEESNKSYLILLEQTNKNTKEIEGLLKIARAVFEKKDLKYMARLVYDVAKELIGSKVGFVSFFSKSHFQDHNSHCDIDGLKCDILDPNQFPIDFLQKKAHSLTEPFIDNNITQRIWKNLPPGHIGLDNLLIAPIILDKDVIGIIGLGNKESGFNPSDIDTITRITEITALCITNIIFTQSLEISELNQNKMVSKLTENEKMLRFALNSANAGVWQWNTDNDEMYWSEELWRLYKLEPNTVKPNLNNWRAIVHPADLKTFDVAINQSRQGRDPLRFEWRILGDDNNISWILTRGSVLDENSRQIIGISIDITRRKLAELELKEAKEEAESASSTKSLFLANMSHELRTPMNAVVGFLDLLETTPLQSQQKVYLNGIRHSAEIMIKLLSDILDLSNLQKKKIQLKPVSFSIRKLLDELIKVFSYSAQQKGLSLHLYIDESIPDMLLGDVKVLRQVFSILLNNAFKYTERGRIELHALLYKKEADNAVSIHFIVKDTGIGIPKDKQELIFESFTQVDMSITRKYQGVGLGLALCKGFVELMKGKIWLESEVGEGSEFHLLLSFEIDQSRLKIKQEKTEDKKLFLKKNLNVLLVEDNTLNQMVLKKLLEKMQCFVDTCTNGLEAINRLEQKRYDLILMDIQMPVMNGDEATRIIRDRSSKVLDHDVPIIAVTAHALDGDRERYMSCGFDDYITKPVKIGELENSIKKAVINRQ